MSTQAPTEAPNIVGQDLEQGDHERFTHIVLEAVTTDQGEVVSMGNSVVMGMVYGTPVRALCGKVWVPSKNRPRYPLCPECASIAKERGWSVPSI